MIPGVAYKMSYELGKDIVPNVSKNGKNITLFFSGADFDATDKISKNALKDAIDAQIQTNIDTRKAADLKIEDFIKKKGITRDDYEYLLQTDQLKPNEIF
jgi:hypothetical protein